MYGSRRDGSTGNSGSGGGPSGGSQKTEYKSLINYYLREGLYQHAADEAEEQIRRRGNDTFLLYWKAFALGMEGFIPEAIREMECLRSKHEIELSVAMALLHFHGKAKMVDSQSLLFAFIKLQLKTTSPCGPFLVKLAFRGREAVETLTATLSITEDMASDGGTLAAARFQWLIGDLDSARRLVSRVQRGEQTAQTPMQQQAFALRGWIDSSIREPRNAEEVSLLKESISYLEGSSQPRDIDTVMGKARYFGVRPDGIDTAADHLNHVIALDPRFWPALIEKAKILASAGDWEQAGDAVARVLALDEANVPALMLHALQGLTQADQAKSEGIDRLRRLSESMAKREPRNAALHLRVSKPFARVCGRDPVLLQLSIGMLESVRDDDNAELLVELGYQLSLSGEYDFAVQAYQAAARANEGDVRAMTGVVYCQVQEGDLEDAAQQLEFLNVMQDSIGSSAEICLVRALLKFRLDRRMDQHLQHLEECAERHEALRLSLPAASKMDPLDRLCVFNPDFMLEIAMEYLLHAGSEMGHSPGQAAATGRGLAARTRSHATSSVSKGLGILQEVVNLVPGHLGARLSMARAFYSTGQADLAHQALRTMLAMDPGQEEAHLLAAQVYLAQGDFRAASGSLEQALSCSFRVGKSPVYLLVKASVLREEGKLEEALETLEDALRLPEVRDRISGSTAARSGSVGSSSGTAAAVTVRESAAIFVATIDVLAKLKRMADASELVREAMALFRGTPEEVQVVVANSELAIQKGDFDTAIKVLADVPPESPAYVKVQSVKATVYLTLRRDKRAYAQCYRDMAQANPCAGTYVLLGEAYMRIQMPEAAIDSFELALQNDPSDSTLAGQIGRALVSTHDYRRAVDYYGKALRGQPSNVPLRHDLARLCLKLGRYDDATEVLREAFTARDATGDTEKLKSDVQTLLIAAEVHEASGAESEAESSLNRAIELQEAVINRARSDSPEAVREAKSLLSRIRREQARFNLEVRRDEGRALECYKETLRDHEGDEHNMVDLAKVHLSRNELEECEKLCEAALRLSDGQREDATMILAEAMFMRTEHGKAIKCYQDVLAKRPNNYEALQKLIDLLRRAGRLDEVSGFLDLARQGDPRSSAHAGLRFCRGLYHRYTNDMNEAVRQFNLARRDGEVVELVSALCRVYDNWLQYKAVKFPEDVHWDVVPVRSLAKIVMALEHMVEIYLSPGGEQLWEVASAPPVEGAQEFLGVARKLLSELETACEGGGARRGAGMPGGGKASLRLRYLESTVRMMMRDKENVDAAMAGFISTLEEDKDNVPAMLGMSTAFVLEDSVNKARNALKRIAKMPYTLDMAEEFEQAYLHLARLYVERGKFDLAQDLCRRCLSFNKSCSQAWETMGLVMEKEQNYRDSAACYEKSWTLGKKSGTAIGYKLAFNYLKARRYVEAIDVCNKVLSQYPDYPKIREEILYKAQMALRP